MYIVYRHVIRLTGRKRNGVAPAHFCPSAGGIARKALQSLESLKLIEKGPDGGRKLTSSGRKDIDRIASQVIFPHSLMLIIAASIL